MLKLIATWLVLGSATAFATDTAPAAPAAPTEAAQQELMSQVQAKYASVDVMKATFRQVSTSALYGGSEQTGTLTLQRPRKMRWDFAGDGKQFITDGETMWIYSPADKQVIRYADFGAGQAMAADSLLQSLDKLEELFEVELLASGDEGHRLGLSPRDEASKAQVKEVVLTLAPDLTVRQVEITDAYDGVTTLSFTELTLGGTADPAAFQFEVPEGVDVVDAKG